MIDTSSLLLGMLLSGLGFILGMLLKQASED
jgi:hypothetical protein